MNLNDNEQAYGKKETDVLLESGRKEESSFKQLIWISSMLNKYTDLNFLVYSERIRENYRLLLEIKQIHSESHIHSCFNRELSAHRFKLLEKY